MTVYPDWDLQSALNAALDETFPTMDVAWENIKFDPTVGTGYLRATLLPAETDLMTIGEGPWQTHQGIFQVDVFYPIGQGPGPAMSKAGEIQKVFCPGARFTYNTLTVTVEKSWPSAGRQDDGWYHIPVNIRYRCESNA